MLFVLDVVFHEETKPITHFGFKCKSFGVLLKIFSWNSFGVQVLLLLINALLIALVPGPKGKGITWLLFLTYAILVREDLRLNLKILALFNLLLQSSDNQEDKISWNRLTTTSSDQSTVLQNLRRLITIRFFFLV